MREAWIPLLRCPVTRAPYDVDATRAGNGEVSEGFLVSREGRELRLVVAGLAVLPRDLRSHLRDFGNVYGKMPLVDSRVVRFVLGQAGHRSHDHVPIDEVARRYADLLPDRPATAPPAAPGDAALARLLAAERLGSGTGLDVGCGVGRGAFVLRDALSAVLGVDRSPARVRRARNIAVTRADFFLPTPEGSGHNELPVDLSRLRRGGVDFAVADADALPLADASQEVVVLRSGDGLGPWPDARAARAEAERVLAPGGLLVVDAVADVPGSGWRRAGEDGPLVAWRRP